MKKIELLAPAGNIVAFRGAVNAGANAVYIGGKKFGARANAENFSLEEIKEAVEFAHLHDTRVYVTINTLIFDDEISSFFAYCDNLVELQVDALIVQDLGVLSNIIKRYPNTEIHVSTQLNTLNINQVLFFEKLGVKRIILARETSLETIKEFQKTTKMEFEVFGHGALCVSYSGNCYMSQMNGSRSGNRGECAQPCRLPYVLLKDGQVLSKEAHLLSTKDLMTLPELEEIISSGVTSIKIEGRMRSLDYIVETIKTYRKNIDLFYESQNNPELQDDITTLATVFNRDFTKGYVLGEMPYELTQSVRPNHQGVLIGKVLSYHYGKTTILLSDTLRVGDGIRVIGKTDIGDQVSKIMKNNESVPIAYANDQVIIDLRNPVNPEDQVMKTMNILFKEESLQFADSNFKSIPLEVRIKAHIGKPFEISISNEEHHVTVKSEYIIEKAQKVGVTKERLFAQVNKLGNTPFYFANHQIQLDENVFIPNIIINETRRQALETFSQKKVKKVEPVIVHATSGSVPKYEASPFSLMVKIETIEQLEVALEFNIDKIVVPIDLDISKFDVSNKTIIKSFKRIEDPKTPISGNESIMIQDIGDLLMTSSNEIYSDVYMNVTNYKTMEFLYSQNIKNITLSMEIGNKEINTIMESFYMQNQFYPNVTVVAYGRLDSMISKYCPITKGENINKTHCDICRKFHYSLQNKFGNIYPLINDGDCNIRVLNHRVLNLIEFLATLEKIHISYARLDFTVETPLEMSEVLLAYRNKMNQEYYQMPEKPYTISKFRY